MGKKENYILINFYILIICWMVLTEKQVKRVKKRAGQKKRVGPRVKLTGHIPKDPGSIPMCDRITFYHILDECGRITA